MAAQRQSDSTTDPQPFGHVAIYNSHALDQGVNGPRFPIPDRLEFDTQIQSSIQQINFRQKAVWMWP